MDNDIDDLIRDAVRRQEEVAVDPERIRAALPARAARKARVQRTRMLVTVAAAASVAVAVAVPTVVLRESADVGVATSPTAPSSAAPSTGSPGSTTAAPSPGAATAPLRYKPTWLPPGLTEWQRSVPLTSDHPKVGVTRTWKTTPAEEIANLGLTAYTSPQDKAPPAPPIFVNPDGTAQVDPGRPVEINGKTGYYDGRTTITWQVEPETKLMLTAPELGLSEDDLFRIARSVQPDDTRLHLPLHTDPLPGGVSTLFATVEGESPDSWEASLFAERTMAAYVSVRYGTIAPGSAAGGEAVTVRGVAARLTKPSGDTSTQPGYRTDWVLTADLGDGRWLTVNGGTVLDSPGGPALTRDDILRIAEQVELDPSADLGWLGD
ncbi:hypothetical protein F4560_001601 [Saccharothrix ecbatanensis]|uniref:Uncharacterized protein n=1 Tax=Saccharothrix ecbatanensis TaxID=1105145 RepID=A0A7W9HH39_9PSEU|nr:hypothetical protein [Saccharothrix ecbatanensis]MBB5801833.1 hypothetical protein [Saccharothrix ecbatanensis]